MNFLTNLLKKRRERKIKELEEKIRAGNELARLNLEVSSLAEKIDPQRFYSEGDDLRKLSDRLWLLERKRLIKKLKWLKYCQKKDKGSS